MADQTISSYYANDHDALDQAMKDFQRLKRTDFQQAKPFFRQFKAGLQRHILWEEEILFPVFEEKTGMRQSGPTAVMRQEHIRILSALEALHDRVRAADAESDAEEKDLIELLKEHNMKEENVLYPAIDSMTGSKERETLFKKMKQVPVERYQSCGCSH